MLDLIQDHAAGERESGFEPVLLMATTLPSATSILYRWDFAGGSPVAKILCSQCRGPRVQSLVRELDPTCHS